MVQLERDYEKYKNLMSMLKNAIKYKYNIKSINNESIYNDIIKVTEQTIQALNVAIEKSKEDLYKNSSYDYMQHLINLNVN